MIALLLYANVVQTRDLAREGCLQFLQRAGISAKDSEVQFDAGFSKGEPFGSKVFKFSSMYIAVSPRTGEVTNLSASRWPFPQVNASHPSDTEIQQVFRLFREPAGWSFRSEGEFGTGLISFHLNRTVAGVPVGSSATNARLIFEQKTGRLEGFVCPPTESTLVPIDQWITPEVATSAAMHEAFEILKKSSQFHLRTCRKVYVGENWFVGTRNTQHRSAAAGANDAALYPCYEVQLDDGDSFFKGSDWPGLYTVVYIDASDRTLFGSTVGFMGGGIVEWVPAPSLDGQVFTSIKFGSHVEQKATLTLHEVDAQPRPSGVDVFLYSDKVAVRVVMDRIHKLVWQRKRTYAYEGDFKF